MSLVTKQWDVGASAFQTVCALRSLGVIPGKEEVHK